MSVMPKRHPSPPLFSRILLYASVENLVYWLTEALVWIPWYFSDNLGMLAMIAITPIFMFIATLYSLNEVPRSDWGSEIRVIVVAFVVTCAVIDLFFWIIWRGHGALEWYLPITVLGTVNFIGYLEIIVVSYVALRLAGSSGWVQGIHWRLSFSLRSIIISGVVLFLFSLVSALLFW